MKYLNDTGTEYLVNKVEEFVNSKSAPIYVTSWISNQYCMYRTWSNGLREVWGTGVLDPGSKQRVKTYYFSDLIGISSINASYYIYLTLGKNGTIVTSITATDRGGNTGKYTDGFITSATTTTEQYAVSYDYYLLLRN